MAVQSIEEMVRTLMIDLESRCGEKLSVEDDFFPWLIEHACDLLNKYKVRRGNITEWEAIKGEPYMGDIYAFGTPVQHRISGSVQWGGYIRAMVRRNLAGSPVRVRGTHRLDVGRARDSR